MIGEDEFHKIIDRAKQNNDVLLWKFVKNIAINGSTPDIQDCLAVYLPDLIKVLFTQSKNEEIKVKMKKTLRFISYIL